MAMHICILITLCLLGKPRTVELIELGSIGGAPSVHLMGARDGTKPSRAARVQLVDFRGKLSRSLLLVK